jgi:hypothetical protein
MHAPVVLQHYLLSINNIRSEIELIDIPRYLASQKELLYKYLKFALSGSSENFLREIYAGDPSFKTNTYTLNPSDYHEILKLFLFLKRSRWDNPPPHPLSSFPLLLDPTCHDRRWSMKIWDLFAEIVSRRTLRTIL